MNNSFKKKINQKVKINLNDLSSTSSEFFLDYSKKKYIKQKGGNCSCSDMFKALSNENLELILYILKQNNCCFKCQDSDSNTVLHLLVPYYNTNEEFTQLINSILDSNCSDFINIQNNQGQTPILLAVMEDDDVLAEKMENAGADVSIEDNNGNFVGSKNENQNQNLISSDNDYKHLQTESESVPVKNIYNVFNFIVQNPQKSDLTSLGINDLLDSHVETNSQNSLKLNTDDFMKEIRNKINNSLNENDLNDSSSSSSSSEYIDLPEIETSVSSMNTDKFITLLDENKKPSFVNYSDVQDTDQFITILRNKYSSGQNSVQNSVQSPSPKPSSDPKPSSKPIPNETITKQNTQNITPENENTLKTETSMMDVDSIDPSLLKLGDQTTSDNVSQIEETKKPDKEITINNNLDNTTKLNSKSKIFLKNSSDKINDQTSSDIDTNTLLKAIKKIQNNYGNENIINDNLMGGGNHNKQKIMGYRNFNEDSDISFINSKKNTLSKTSEYIDYNTLYNSDSEYGAESSTKNELKRMMSRQKETLHNEVLEMIMGMLNKGLLLQSNKPIEATEKNAKLVKAFIYRYVSEKNPEMGGMDKILSIKTMNENEIVNIVKKMPSLSEIEESIKKHLEEKNKNKANMIDSEKSESPQVDNDKKKSSKKSSKKSTDKPAAKKTKTTKSKK